MIYRSSDRCVCACACVRRAVLAGWVVAGVLLGLATRGYAAAKYSLEGVMGAPTDFEVIVFDLAIAVEAPDPLEFRTYSHSGSGSSPTGANHAGDVIPAGGFDPVLELFNAVDTVAVADDGTGITGNFDSLMTLADVPTPLPADVYGIVVEPLGDDFNGLNPNWALDMTGPHELMTLVLPETIDQSAGVQGVSRISVVGAGSNAFRGGDLIVGNDGLADLQVFDGGFVEVTGSLTVGANPGSFGVVAVDGLGSLLTTTFMDVGGDGISPGGIALLIVTDGAEVELTDDSMIVWPDAEVVVENGTITMPKLELEAGSTFRIENDSTVNLTGADPVFDDGGQVFWGTGVVNIAGDVSLGHALLPGVTSLNDGQELYVAGTLAVGAGQTLATSGTGVFEAQTLQLDGGTVVTPFFDADLFTTINGQGVILGELTFGTGTTINAEGPLSLGDPTSTSGFDFFGELNVGGHRVILNDADQALLADVNTIGAGGSINAVNGALLLVGTTLTATGPARIEGDFQNDGTVNGPVAPTEFLTFEDDVSGVGDYTGNIEFLKGFSPGDSAAEVVRIDGSARFSALAKLVIELGSDSHDQLAVTHSLTAGGALTVRLLDGYRPVLGEGFEVLRFGEVGGAFTEVHLPVLGGGLGFDASELLTTGRLVVVPEPGTLMLVPACLWAVRPRRGVRAGLRNG